MNTESALENDVYFSLAKPGRFDLKVKGSRFIGHAAAAGSREVAEMLVDSISRKYHDASHHCYAFRIGAGDRSIFRANDAGEPSGTAGKPILEAIDRRRLSDVVCVVVRYFGGTKLGTGGLARTYGECASGSFERGEIVEKYIMEKIRIDYGCEWTGKVMALVKRYGCKIEKGDFQTRTVMDLQIRKSKAVSFRLDLINATSGKVRITESYQ
jgi:uncharacterized YigZ family protein